MSKTETPATPAALVIKGFTIAVETEVTADAAGARTGGVDPMPFIDVFTALEAVTMGDDAKNASFFVPVSYFQDRHVEYWTKRGQTNQIKQQGAKEAKEKIVSEFKKYQGDNEARKALKLAFAVRTGKEQPAIKGVTEAGLTVWVVPAPKSEAPEEGKSE